MFKNLEEAKKHYSTKCSLTDVISVIKAKRAKKTEATDDSGSRDEFLKSFDERIFDSVISCACEEKKEKWDTKAASAVNLKTLQRACKRHVKKHRLLKEKEIEKRKEVQ